MIGTANQLTDFYMKATLAFNGLILELKFGENPEAVAQRCSVEKVFLEISQNSQENTCVNFI